MEASPWPSTSIASGERLLMLCVHEGRRRCQRQPIGSLSTRSGSDPEANFWQPSPHGCRLCLPVNRFCSRQRTQRKYPGVDIPGYSLVGGGFFDEYVEWGVSEAWTIWGLANGVATEQELLARARSYRASSATSDPDPTIGCVILRNIFFAAAGKELAEPPRWPRNVVTLSRYDLAEPSRKEDTEYVGHALALLRRGARVDLAWEPDLRGVDLDWRGPRIWRSCAGPPAHGQGHFKRAVATAYRNRCAVTSRRDVPELGSRAHPPIRRGWRACCFQWLAATDVHRLFDRGYLSVDPDLRLRVSRQLQEHGWNGVEFCQREAVGHRIPAPENPLHQPDCDALAWQTESRFRAA